MREIIGKFFGVLGLLGIVHLLYSFLVRGAVYELPPSLWLALKFPTLASFHGIFGVFLIVVFIWLCFYFWYKCR